MLNPGAAGALDQRTFAQAYGQQANAAGFTLGNLAGQVALQQGGLARGGALGQQALAAQQGRFTAQNQAQALQNNLQQQLAGQYQARQGALGNATLQNGLLGGNAVAAGVRAGVGGLGGLAGAMNNPQLNAALRPQDRSGLGLGNIGIQQNVGLQNYQQQQATLAVLTNQQNLNLQQNLANARLAGVNLQQQQQNPLLQNARLQNMGGNLGVNMLQQNLQTGNAQTGQDLLSMLAGQKRVQQPVGQAGNEALAAIIKQQQQQQQAGRAAQGADFSIANPDDFPALTATAQQQRNDADNRGGFGGMAALANRAGFMMGQNVDQFGGAQSNAQANLADQARAQGGLDYEQLMRLQQQQQQGLNAGQVQGPGRPGSVIQSKGSVLLGAGGGAQGAGGSQVGLGADGGNLALKDGIAAAGSQAAGTGLQGAAGGGAAGAPGRPAQQPDKWGLLAIMPLLKMTDQEATTLELGINLTTLGLDLTSPSSLYKSLVTPLSSQPIKAEPEFELPSCYKHVPQRLQAGHLTKFKEETLFYIFYSMPADEAQLIAADELSVRGWMFHKRLRMWMVAAPHGPPPAKTQRGERGAYLVFNPTVWEAEQKQELEILYEDIEVAPRLPRPPRAPGNPSTANGPVQGNPQQQPGQQPQNAVGTQQTQPAGSQHQSTNSSSGVALPVTPAQAAPAAGQNAAAAASAARA